MGRKKRIIEEVYEDEIEPTEIISENIEKEERCGKEELSQYNIETDIAETKSRMIKMEIDLTKSNEKLEQLADLFSRRLLEDKQKNGLISTLQSLANFAVIEPFLQDIILLIDRLEQATDEFSVSILEELLEILSRRGVEQIQVNGDFNPLEQKIVKVHEQDNIDEMQIYSIFRNGYKTEQRIIRTAEISVLMPKKKMNSNDNEYTEEIEEE